MKRAPLARSAQTLTAAVAAAGVLAACGSGGATTTATSPNTHSTQHATHPDTGAACQAWVAADDAVKSGPGQDDGPPPSADQVKQFATQLSALLQKFIDVAPTAQRASAGELLTEIGKAAVSGDPAAMDSSHNPEQASQINAIETWVRTSCGFQNLTVMGVDYGYQGLPAIVKAGATNIEFMNHSDHQEMHEIVLLRIRPSAAFTAATLVQALKADPAAAEQRYGPQVESVTGLQAPAGELAYITTRLAPGHYVAACFVGTPAHVTEGMIESFDAE